MDLKKSEIYQFTNANVDDGSFNYSSSSKRVRHSVAVVRYNDKFNFYQPAIEYVEDAEAIKKYGYKELEVAAFGCTSRGQAIRYGRWALLSETMETETVSFQAGLESTYLRPGDVFKIFDRNKKNTRHGGRISYIRGNNNESLIVLDDLITGFRSQAVYNL
jgi:predicted phage tail protein